MSDILSLRKMLATADKRYDDAAIEPDNPNNVSNERASHDALEYHVGQAVVAG
ncbi:hypothetical protein LC608_36685 [Nostoc sp. XA010]|uniref:hypothetical protein n=1 Tax=Nostoc sp. XA010 TaxID=2780407 RepID=UPI001E3AC205|nr:hypothetical protein [Nostoc sp. XA010]MCC5662342.1 hypothetical protein [Nostoc sp. XA010]